MRHIHTETHSYLLRLWRYGQENPWRIELENIQNGEVVRFPDLDAFWIHLNQTHRPQTGEPVSSKTEATNDTNHTNFLSDDFAA